MSFAHLMYKARQAESRSCGNLWLKRLVCFSLERHLLWGRVADGSGHPSTVRAQGLVWHQSGSDGEDFLVTLKLHPL